MAQQRRRNDRLAEIRVSTGCEIMAVDGEEGVELWLDALPERAEETKGESDARKRGERYLTRKLPKRVKAAHWDEALDKLEAII